MSNDLSINIDHQLWLQRSECLSMITEEKIYIDIVEHEHSSTAHITSFDSLEYQIEIILGELGKTNYTYIVIIHLNDILEMLRTRPGLYYKFNIDQLLFPASKLMSSQTVSTNNGNNSLDDVVPEPKCSTSESCLAAYDVLVKLVVQKPLLEKQTEWGFMPQVNPRALCRLVKLYNGGATCYMNSILQQLSMLPQISEHTLSVPNDLDSANRTTKTSDSNLFYQPQQVIIWSFNAK
ncbi:unnamed protein product [Rotaria sp. Silwood2]|nr:unnamed protein product [Rotaria sp. Silwood2]CAF4475887.1 unnamed protein product [Rotaria sp. Silwood2]